MLVGDDQRVFASQQTVLAALDKEHTAVLVIAISSALAVIAATLAILFVARVTSA